MNKSVYVHRIQVVVLFMAACNSGTAPSPDGGLKDSVVGDAILSDAVQKDAAVDPTQVVFDLKRLLNVEVTVDEKSWDQIRQEGRSLNSVWSGCADPNFKYTQVAATLSIDNTSIGQVELRKKGFLGSLSAVRPSLKIDVDKFQKDQNYHSVAKLTLNNNRQDPSNVRQCLSYLIFEKAGVRAPRCNLAHVVVNGRNLGIYSNVESIDDAFLMRAFGNKSGNLYEGQISDFVDGLVSRFEAKNNEKKNDRSDLDAVVNALKNDDTKLLAALEPLVDIDSFITYWATEVLLGHWDSYSGNLNNFYIYRDTSRGKFYFIPWGADGSFQEEHALNPAKIPASVYAWGVLARRLYGIPQTRDKYRTRLSDLLKTVWNETELLAEVDRVQKLISKDNIITADAVKVSLDQLRNFIQKRRGKIEPELKGVAPVWDQPSMALSDFQCRSEGTPVSGTFSTTFGSLDSPSSNSGQTLTIQVDGKDATFSGIASSAGNFVLQGNSSPAVRVFGLVSGFSGIIVQLTIEPSQFQSNTEVKFHGFESFGAVVKLRSATDFSVIGYVGNGQVKLEKAATKPNDPVSGTFSGTFIQTAPSE